MFVIFVFSFSAKDRNTKAAIWFFTDGSEPDFRTLHASLRSAV